MFKIHKEIPNFENKQDNSIEKEMIEDVLLRLRILGKFLGYLVFLPYQYTLSSSCIKDLVSIRNNVSFSFKAKLFLFFVFKSLILIFQSSMPINLPVYIEKAIAKRHLIVTIPMLVEFLSMMDEHAFLVDSIQQSISFLIMIFKYSYSCCLLLTS
jgi:codanin-1